MKKHVLFLFLALSLAACQSTGKAATPTPVLTQGQPATLQTNIQPSAIPTTAPKTATQPADVAGVWVVTSYPHSARIYWILSTDGNYAYSPNADGSNPTKSGKFWFNNGEFNLIDESLECNTPGKYQVQVTTQANGGKLLASTLIDDQCQTRVGLLTGAPATWFQPLPSTPITPMTTPKIATQAADLAGVWVVTSHPDFDKVYWLLSMDGKYAYSTNVDGSDAVATGKFWFDNGQFYITDDTYMCQAPGKYQVQVNSQAGEQKMLAFTPIDDECQWRVSVLTDAPATWLQPLAPEPSATP